MNVQEDPPHHDMQKSPVRSQSPRPTEKNRKVVLVGETFLSSKQQTVPQKPSSLESLPRVESSVSLHCSSDTTSSIHNAHSTALLVPSAVSSPRTSVSSMVDLSTMSNLVMTPSSEEHILKELREQIASSAERIRNLEVEKNHVSVLKSEVVELRKEGSKLANTLQDQQEIAKSLKQRVTMLHEQNSQLGKLLKAQQGGSEEVIAMRNTIIASLAQLKQLQEQVNAIPGLKSQVNALEQAQDQFYKEASSSSLAGNSQTLLEENSLLRATNAALVEEMKIVWEQLTSVSQSCDGLKHRMDAFANTQAQSIMLREQVKQLEAEKDALCHEIIDLKFHDRRSLKIDSAELGRQMASLQKANIELRKTLDLTQQDARQQKEQLVLKLFEIEAMNVKTHKYELEKQVLEMEQLQIHTKHQPILHTPNVSETRLSSDCDDAALSPESKIQMLKLEQLHVHITQSRNVMQAVVADRDELERRVAELSTLVKDKGIDVLMDKLSTSETRLSLAINRNEQLEREIEAMLKPGGSAVMEIERLNEQLEKLKMECSSLAESNIRLKNKYRRQKEAIQELEIVKQEKGKAERKYKDCKEKLRALAIELTGSIALLKDYQDKCESQENTLELLNEEVSALRQKYAAAITDLEIANAEKRSESSESQLLSESTVGSNHTSVNEERDRQKVVDTLREMKAKNEALSREVKNLHTALAQVSESLSEITETKSKLEKKAALADDAQALVTELTVANRGKEEELLLKHKEILSLTSKIQRLEEGRILETTSGKRGDAELRTVTECRKCLKIQMASDEREQAFLQFKTDKNRELAQLSKELNELKKDLDTIRVQSCTIAEARSNFENTIVEQARQIGELHIDNEKHRQLHADISMKYEEVQEVNHDLRKQLEVTISENHKLEVEKQNMDQKCLEVEQRAHSATAVMTDLEEAISALKQDYKKAQDSLRIQRKELENMQSRNLTLNNEVEGYCAMVSNLTRQIDEAEAREMDHEVLRQKVHRLERALSDSSSQQLKVDNQALFTMLQEAVSELPSPSTVGGSQSLQEENLRLEQQVSILSQWNDKQRQEIENLEIRLDELLSEKEIMEMAGQGGEIMQLRRELLETEHEVNALRRQVRADLKEEMQVKVEAQAQMLSVFSDHNQRLQLQVEELQQQVRSLGGRLARETAVSPPPFPDPTNTASLMERGQTFSEITQENKILSQRLSMVEEHLCQLQKLCASVHRCSSSLLAITSMPVVSIIDGVQIRYMQVNVHCTSVLFMFLLEQSLAFGMCM